MSFLRAQAPLLFPGTPYRDLVLADPGDTAVMKVIAIGGRGSRKDFVDLYFFLRAGGTLDAVFELLRPLVPSARLRRVPPAPLARVLRRRRDRADAAPDPPGVGWREIKEAILAEVRRLA